MTDCANMYACVLEVMQIRNAHTAYLAYYSTTPAGQGRAGQDRAGQGKGLTSTTNTQMP